ncbi:hypothetical protein L6452_07684 [Arctium lappa]|uniref:Uncharacterized protein n=1 Tax=Arctium lappa TaxID=4217 RepID=A0ACB9EML3_ARCLA|nr:hypothetical protein L6452_07684 [Arctium lappa]
MDAKNDRPRRNLARRKPQKRRKLSDIYELGSCIGGNEGNVDSEFTTDAKNCSDDITLDTFIREKKRARVTSKNSGALKNKRKAPQVVEPKLDRAKREKRRVRATSKNSSSLKNKRKTPQVMEPRLARAKRSKPENDRPRRNLARKIRLKRRNLSDVNKELGSCFGGSEGNVDSTEFTTDTENYTNDVTLETFLREKRRVRATNKNSGALKNKRKTPVSYDSLGNDSDLGSKLRKNRSIKPDLQTTDKHKKSSIETRRSCATRKAKGVLNLCDDGNQKHFTAEGNCLRRAHGAKTLQLVPTTAISNKNTETGSVQKRIRESSPLSDNMAALQLLRIFNAGVNTKTSYMTATEDRALSVTEPKSLCGMDGGVQPSSGSTVHELLVEVNVITGAAGLPQADQQTESGTCICPMSRNPAEFSITIAKKFMRKV